MSQIINHLHPSLFHRRWRITTGHLCFFVCQIPNQSNPTLYETHWHFYRLKSNNWRKIIMLFTWNAKVWRLLNIGLRHYIVREVENAWQLDFERGASSSLIPWSSSSFGKAIGEVALVLPYERFLKFFHEPTLYILMNMTR